LEFAKEFFLYLALSLGFTYGIVCAFSPKLAIKIELQHNKIMNPFEVFNKNIRRDTKLDVIAHRIMGIIIILLISLVFYVITSD
jgi:hypothetical protein